ncbi:MAG: PAS domain-containing protein [Thermoleophilaceae bacterium]|nr:PAS domain-containing protein [Thermoleophilaceae bacterium]
MNGSGLPSTPPTEFLTALVESVTSPLALVDRSLRFVYANQAAAEQVNTPREQMLGEKVSKVIPRVWPEVEVLLTRALNGESMFNLEIDLSELTPDRRDWIGTFCPVMKDGEIVGVACTSFDVTDLRALQDELQIRRDLYAMLARANAAMVASGDRDELFREICEIAVELGKFHLAWIGEPVEGNFVRIASAGVDESYVGTILQPGFEITTDPLSVNSQGPTGIAYRKGEVSVENDFLGSAATAPWHEAAKRVGFASSAAFPIRQEGKVVAVLALYASEKGFFTEELVAALSEMTPSLSIWMDWHALEQRRKESEAELQMRDRALAAANQGVVITDALAEDNPIIYATPAFANLTGYAPEELIGRNCRILQGARTDPETVKQIGEALAAGRSCEVELINYRKDGTTFWNHLAISPVLDDGGTLTHFIGVQTDVTERKEFEQRARQAQKLEAIGQLAGGIAHDFNNALTAIRASAELALMDLKDESLRDDLLQIDRAAEHAAELTRQLLAFSRQQVLKPEPTDLNQVLSETMSLAHRLIGENITLSEELGAGVRPVLVDRAQLQQVIMNLAINARDAMPEGGRIEIRTSLVELDESDVARQFVPEAGTYVLLELSDSGVGMDAVAQSKVFEPFYTTKSEGTGLGLATVHGIILQSGGQITVESEFGVGTTFKVFLPTTLEEATPEPSAPSERPPPPDTRETILHVEDSESLRPLVIRALGRHGYKILSASSAEEALELADEHPGEIDLLLTDIVMPGLNGRELAEILAEKMPGLKVLFTSGYPADLVIREGIAESEINFIEKPFRAVALADKVRAVLDS